MNVDAINKVLITEVVRHLGNKVTDNTQLDKVGRRFFGKKYIGTFPSDQIPRLKPNTYCIANLDATDEPGSHWVALVKSDDDELIVYDSFGRFTSVILPHLTREYKHKIVDTEHDSEQGLKETNCGARSMAAILMYHRYGKKMLLKL